LPVILVHGSKEFGKSSSFSLSASRLRFGLLSHGAMVVFDWPFPPDNNVGFGGSVPDLQQKRSVTMSMSGRILKKRTFPVRLVPLVAGCLLLLLAAVQSKAQAPIARDTRTVRGKVERFTTAPKGEIDGAILDDGTTLHWPPHVQGRFTAILKEGDRVRAAGRTETGPAGDTHFEVQNVTNLRTDAEAENPDFANGPPPPPPGRGVAPGRAADREQRLRDLENQVEQIRREIRRLRREK
jgi:hypothetical protein